MLSNSGFISAQQKPNTVLVETQLALSFSKLVSGECLIAHHKIVNGLLQTGSPIDADNALKLLETLSSRPAPDTWVNHNILYESDSLLVWHTNKNKNVSLWFSQADKPSFELKAKLPALVFVRKKLNSHTSIFAVAGHGRPNKNTKLYAAPLCNPALNGSFCLGSATVPVGLVNSAEMIKGTEDGVFKSSFTHISHNKTFRAEGGVDNQLHIKKWRELVKQNKAPMAADLTPLNMTLAEMIKEAQ